MIFFMASDGTIVKSIPSPVYQGAEDANSVYLVAPFSPSLQVTVAFRLPNGVLIPQNKMTWQNELSGIVNEKSGKAYAAWSYDLPRSVTQYYGTVTAQFYFYSASEGKILVTSATTFSVGKGVSVELPDLPVEDIYESILHELAEIHEELLNGYYSARAIYAWNSSYIYGANEIVYFSAKGECGVFLKSLTENNASAPYENGVLNADSWQEIVDFNILNELYNTKSEIVQMADAAAQSASDAAQSAADTEEAMEAAIAAAQDAQSAAELARTFAQYGIKGNTDYTSVDELPVPGNAQFLYFIPNGESGENCFDEWIWVQSKNAYELIGTTKLDLSGYLTKTNAAEIYLNKIDAENTYLAQADAESTYLSKSEAASTYLANGKTVKAANVDAETAVGGQILTADGSGGAEWKTVETQAVTALTTDEVNEIATSVFGD